MKKLKKLSTVFLQGLAAVVPIALTLFILFWLLGMTESIFGGMIKALIPDRFYIPGMGFVAGLLIVMAVGLLLRFWIFKKIYSEVERLFVTLPLIKSLYGSIQDLMGFFDSSKKKEFNKVVSIDLIDNGSLLMGFVTREDFSDLSGEWKNTTKVAVYLPMSYQLGGFTIFVDKSKIKPVEMSIEEAMRFIFTAAVSTKNSKPQSSIETV